MLKETRRGISISPFIPSVIKTERINALRKRYDAFLEEDKQRKDRNCFILERLDKMCFSSAAVQLQSKRNINLNHQLDACTPIDKQTGNFRNYSTQVIRHVASDFPKKIDNEPLMIQELSKKYILIPKINNTSPYNNITSNKNISNDDFHWKHKYEILDRLKKNELDTEFTIHEKENYSSKANTRNDELENSNNLRPVKYKIPEEFKDNDSNQELITETTPENVTKYMPNYGYNITHGEVNKNPTLLTFDQSVTTRPNLNNDKFKNTEIKRSSNNNVTPLNVTLNAERDCDNGTNSFENETETSSDIKNYYREIDSENIKSDDLLKNSEKHVSIQQEHNLKHIQNNMFEKDDKNTVAELNRTDSAKKIIYDTHTENLKEDQHKQYLGEITNVTDFNPKSNMTIESNIDINPQQCINYETVNSSYPSKAEHFTNQEILDCTNETPVKDVIESVDNPDITSGIEAFDAEQREMFYSEEAQKGYEYDPSNIQSTHDQKYNANNEHYQQNTEYYEGVQSEQAYPDEINEHEETSQRYDQTYEQQYTNYEQEKHENEQQEYKEPQQYKEPVQYDQPPNHEQQGYEEPQQYDEPLQYDQPPQHEQTQQYDQLLQHEQPLQYDQHPQHEQPLQYDQHPQHEQTLQYDQFPQHEQPLQYDQHPQHEQPLQYDEHPQHEQTLQYDQLPQHEQPLQYDQHPEHEQTLQYDQLPQHEQPLQYDQHPQHEQLLQYEPQIDDIIQPEIDQTQYEQHNYETQAYVEEQIDREQGLIEKHITDENTIENHQTENNQAEHVAD